MAADPSNLGARGVEPPESRGLSLLRGSARVTPVLIALNVAVFVLMVLSGVSFTDPTTRQLLTWGADFGPLTTSGQWWRLVSACFLHVGVIHIAMNMYILYQVGMFTERLFGSARYLALYLVAGIGGSVLSVMVHPMIVSAGASGAIFGVYGGLLAFLLTHRAVMKSESVKAIAKSALIFLGYNLVYGLASPHTDMMAHLGGLLTGFVMGLVLSRPLARAQSGLVSAR